MLNRVRLVLVTMAAAWANPAAGFCRSVFSAGRGSGAFLPVLHARGSLCLGLLLGVQAHASDTHDAETQRGGSLLSISLAPYNCAQAAEPLALVRSVDTTSSAEAAASALRTAPVSPRGRGFRAALIELPRNQIPGQYSRPHYALGVRSTRVKRWMEGIGLDADTCLAPVLRMRTKLSSDGDLNGALWVYARCTFH
jgi:hypothetical protein